MGLFDFVKSAGSKIFGGDDDKPAAAVKDDAADRIKAAQLVKLVGGMDMAVEDLGVRFEDGVATLTGKAASQEVKEKVVLLVGNTQGVARVDDRMTVEKPAPEARLHTVERGDTLSKIAKQYYGDAMKYPVIFEANKPMLKDPDKIYPGQVLRIPPLDA